MSETKTPLVPEGKRNFAVDAYFGFGEKAELTLYESNSLSDYVHFFLLWDASVKVSNGRDTVRMSNLLYTNSKTKRVVNYVADLDIREGDSLALSVLTPTGETLSAGTKTVSVVKIESAGLGQQTISVETRNSSNYEENYYLLEVSYFDTDTVRSDWSYHYDMSEDRAEKVRFEVDLREESNDFDSLFVSLTRMTESGLRFRESLRKASQANVDPFNRPEVLEGNISGGVGIFTYVRNDSRWLYP
ncbi:DUF4249 family protein [Fulvitalea axinellae]|uniref:DUF4249 family protein n=1 Tax=Fulvitalea axinellae TaxID=1182444 RepID=UPI0030CA137B